VKAHPAKPFGRELLKMNINRHHYLSILILISLIILSFPQTLLSQQARPTESSGQERLAVISKFEGEVRIKHEGEWKTVTKVGNRIRNSSIYSNDTVLTMPGSTADLVFNDNSRLEIKEDTTLEFSTKQITEEELAQEGFIRKVAGTQKEIVRNINLKVGRIWANITPSKSVLTEFETPTGVASVRGTQCSIAHIVKTIIEVLAGELGFLCDIGTALLKKDTKIEVSVDKKVVTLNNIGKNPFTINDITVGKNSAISAGVTKEGIRVISTNGEVTRNGKDVKPGDSIDDDSGTVYGAQILGEGEGGGGVDWDDGDDSDDGDDGDDSDAGDDGDDSDAGSISQNNKTLLESSTGGDEDVVPPRIFDVFEDNTLTITDFEILALANVIDADGNALISPPSNGISAQGGTVVSGNSLDYTPPADFNGIDSFTYTISNVGDEPIEGTVNINVVPVNDQPTFDMAGDQQVDVGAGLQAVSGWADNMYTGSANESGQSLTFNVTSDSPALFAVQPAIDAFGNLTYTPADDAFGSASVDVSLSDSGGTANGGDDTSPTQTFMLSPVFSDDFSSGTFATKGWDITDNAYIDTSFGPITSPDNSPFAIVHNGLGNLNWFGNLSKHFNVAESGNFHISGRANFVTTEFTDSMPDNDIFTAGLIASNGNWIELDFEPVLEWPGPVLNPDLTLVGGLPVDVLDGSDDGIPGSGGQTGWFSYDSIVYLPSGQTTLEFFVDDGFADDEVDSAGLVEDIIFDDNVSDFPMADEVFSDNFSSGGFSSPQNGTAWDTMHNAYVDTSFGPITSPDNSPFAIIHTGLGDLNFSGFLEKIFNFNVSANKRITFDLNWATTEFTDSDPENDMFDVVIVLSDGNEVELAYGEVFNENRDGFNPDLTRVDGLPVSVLDGSDDGIPGSGGQTGWLSYDSIVYVPSGQTKLIFSVFDQFDGFVDSALFIDNVVDPIVDLPTSTDYLLTFARMMRGDMDTHDMNQPGDVESHSEHQTFIDKVDEVVGNIESNPDSLSITDIFNDLEAARDSLINHDDVKEPMQHTAIAQHLLDSKMLTDGGFAVNLTSIDAEMTQAKAFLDAHINDFGDTIAHRDIRSQMDSVLTDIDNVKNNVYDTATASQISSGVKEAFCDVIDHMVHSDAGHSHEVHHEENSFSFCHHDEGGGV
jgi:hypothetical protein